MSHCDKCNVDILGNHKACPLCKNKIDNIHSIDVFPKIPTTYEKHRTLFLWLYALTFIGIITSIVTNIYFTPHIFWCIFVILGFLTGWVIIYFAIVKKSNLIKFIFYQSILLVILSLLWDYGTGYHAWSINYVLPSIFGIGLALTFVLNHIKRINAYEVLIYLILQILLGFVPLIFILTKYLYFVIPSLICVLISQTALVILIIFESRNILQELERRLHL